MQDLIEVKDAYLRPWDEVVGVLKERRVTPFDVTLLFKGYKVSFPLNSPEGEWVQNLDDTLIGQRIGVLRTDLPNKPLLLRVYTTVEKR